MDNKHKFEEIINIEKSIAALQTKLDEQRRIAAYSGISYGERVSHSQDNSSERKSIAAASTAWQIEKLIAEKEKRLQTVLTAIQTVEDELLQAVLIQRYINGKTISEVADILGYSPQHINILLRRAEQAAKFK